MHNCKRKRTREDLIDMAVSKAPSGQDGSLWAELEQCAACREEFESIRNALRVTDQAMQSALPAESFWPDYHAKLRHRLERASTSRLPEQSSTTGGLVRLRNFVTASIRVPVPLAATVIVLFVFSVWFTIHSRNVLRAAPAPSTPSVITKTVEVPVVREKPVMVYVERNRRTARHSRRREETDRNVVTTVARRQREPNPPAGLVGFKPANDVKLTIIKGSYRDDK